MKVVKVNHGNVFNAGNWYTWHCPKCSNTLELRNTYCSRCNQLIEWEQPTNPEPTEVAMSNQPAPKSAEEVLKEFELDDLIYRNVIIKAMQSYASQSAPRYVPDEEIDAMWPDAKYEQGRVEDKRQAAKSMRDMIFGGVKQ